MILTPLAPIFDAGTGAYRSTIVPGVLSLRLKAPLAVQFELLSECNYRCGTCYNVWKGSAQAHPQQSRLTSKEKQGIVRRIIDWEVFDLIFSGGEPLQDKDLSTLIGLAEDNRVSTSLITNAALLSPQKCMELKRAGLQGVQISLQNADPENNDRATRTPGSFQLTVAGIGNAVAAFGSESVSINMVLTRDNYVDVLPTARFIAELGASQFSIGALSETGEALLTGQTLSRSQFQHSYRDLLKARSETGLAVGVSGGFPLCILTEIDEDPLAVVSNFCDAGLNQVVIAPNGDMRACVCFPQVLGNILNDDPKAIWDSAHFLTTIRNLEHVPPECYSCKYVALCKGGCRAAAWAASQDLQAPDPLGVRQ